MALSREQKGKLAGQVISYVANIVEFWGEMAEGLPADSPLRDLSADEVREQIASWMKTLPGDAWDIRLDAAR